MCKGYYDVFLDCVRGHMIRTSIVYCHNSVHDEGEKERHVPCEEFDGAAEGSSEYHVADYPCPKCECTEEEYLPEHGRPWARAREKIFSQITTRALDLVYGDREDKKKESVARIERLRTIGHGENRAWELAARLQQDLEGEGYSFRHKARRIAERVREDLEGVNVARMRDEARHLAQQLRNNLEATDEGSNDMWEHMNFCLAKESIRVGAKSKRLKVLPDERERNENAEKDKPEQYQAPKVELIFHWDHNQQGRPPSKKSSKWTFPHVTNSNHELSRLSNHMKIDLPQAHLAYEGRRIWKESRKRSRQALEQDEEDDGGSDIATSGLGQETDIGPAAKWRPQTNRSRRDNITAKRERQWQTPSPLYTDNLLAGGEDSFGLIPFPSTANPIYQQSMRPIAPATVIVNPEDPTPSSNRSLQAGAPNSRSSINEPNLAFLEPDFASSPSLIAPSTGPSAAISVYNRAPHPSVVSSPAQSAWPSAGYEGNVGSTVGYAPPGGELNSKGLRRQQDLPAATRARVDLGGRVVERGSFHTPYQTQNGEPWSPFHVLQPYRPQMPALTNPPTGQRQGNSGMAGQMSFMDHSSRSTGPIYADADQGATSAYGYGHKGQGNSADFNSMLASTNARVATSNGSSDQSLSPFGRTLFPAPAPPVSGYGYEYNSGEHPTSFLRDTASYESPHTGVTYRGSLSVPQDVTSSTPTAPQSTPYAGAFYDDGMIDPRMTREDNASNLHHPVDQVAGQVGINYDFTNDENYLLDLVNQGLSPQQPSCAIPPGNGNCANPDCKECR